MIYVPEGIQKMMASEKYHLRPSVNSSTCRRVLLLVVLFQLVAPAKAELPQWWKDLHQYNEATNWHEYYTYTSANFGPNALPVPEILDGRVPDKSSVEISTDFFWGFGDQTQSISPRITHTFLAGKIAVSGWGVLAEHYKTTLKVRDQRASMDENPQKTLFVGDFYLSTLMSLCRDKKNFPDLTLEIVLKTASSESPMSARYLDTPGYYFDLTAGKSWYFKHSFINELRFSAMYGFLCYQLNNGRQNDAPLFGGKITMSSKKGSFENSIGGYKGWLGQGDAPLVLRSRLNLLQGPRQLFLEYQHALRDYPFRRLQAGVKVDL